MTNIKAPMIRTFHPVGHGAFYTERFYDKAGKCICSVVYDCGGKSKKFVANRIKETFKDGNTVDWLFISHLHRDHINGVSQLLEWCNVKHIILPALEKDLVIEALLYNYIETKEFDNDANKFIEQLLTRNLGNTKITHVGGRIEGNNNVSNHVVDSESIGDWLTSGIPIQEKKFNWLYYPINLSSSDSESIIKKLAEAAKVHSSSFYSDGKLNYTKIREVVKGIGIFECAQIYEEVFGGKHNSYSMPLISIAEKCKSAKCKRKCKKVGGTPMRCLTNCLYTGDFEAASKCNDLLKIFKDFEIDYAKIGILQVPHHGSQNNLNCELYKTGKLCIISAGENDRYKHPDMAVLSAIQQECSIPIIVTEDEKTKQQLRLVY